MRRNLEEVEQDLADRGYDLRDWWRPRGGTSRMTTRRLLLLVDALPKTTSRFWCKVLDADPLSEDQWIMSDIYAAVASQPHAIRTRREDAEKRRRIAEKKARIARREKRRKRSVNNR